MSSLAKILQVNSDQHKELSVSRKRRDKFDLQKDGTEAINWMMEKLRVRLSKSH